MASPQPLRRHLQPARTHAEEVRHLGDLRGRPGRPGAVAGRRPAQHQAVLRRDRSPTPSQDVLDIEGVAGVAHEAGVPLIVDNTVSTPYLIRPIEWGADIVVHSATKYLGGHGAAIGGVIVDAGNFDFAQDPERFPGYNTPDPTYNGLVYARDLGVGRPARRQPLLHPQGPRAAAARPRLGDLPVQRVPHRAGHRDAEPAGRAARRERREGRRLARGPRRRRLGRLRRAAQSSPWYERSRKYAPAGRGRRPRLRDRGGAEAGRRSSTPWSCTRTSPTSATCARWSSTRRRPPTASSPPRSRAAGVTPGPGPAVRRHRAHRRHPRGPRRRLPRPPRNRDPPSRR